MTQQELDLIEKLIVWNIEQYFSYHDMSSQEAWFISNKLDEIKKELVNL